MSHTISFKLVTPERVLFEEDIVSITVPTPSGEITVLPGHMPLVSAISDGVAELKRPDGSIDEIAISDGFLHIKKGDEIMIIAEMAERGADIDLDAIEKARAAGEKAMQEKIEKEEVLDESAIGAMTRELARYKAAMRYKKRNVPFHHTPGSDGKTDA